MDINLSTLVTGREAVSYTHLDVYKRQVIYMPVIPAMVSPTLAMAEMVSVHSG